MASTAGEPSIDDEPTSTDEAPTGLGTTASRQTSRSPKPASQVGHAGNEPPLVRPPGPTFHSAAPQQPTVVPAVEETASE
jgi:hypothetical protein